MQRVSTLRDIDRISQIDHPFRCDGRVRCHGLSDSRPIDDPPRFASTIVDGGYPVDQASQSFSEQSSDQRRHIEVSKAPSSIIA